MQFTISVGMIIVVFSHTHLIILKLCQQRSYDSRIILIKTAKLFLHNTYFAANSYCSIYQECQKEA